MTYRDITPDDLTLPGDVLGGALDSMLAGGDLYVDEFECSPGAWQVRDALCRVLMERGHDLFWLHNAEVRGDVTPLVAAALWWCSALRVEAEIGPIVADVSPWMRPKWAGEAFHARHRAMYDGGRLVCIVDPRDSGWMLQPPSDPYSRASQPHGPELGDAGKAAADAAALSAGYALRNPDHLLLPLPDAVARLPLENA